MTGTTTVLLEIADERLRQIEGEGFTREHDDNHDPGELAAAGAAYAVNASDELHPFSQGDGQRRAPPSWPWDIGWWRPKNPRRDLVRAAALLVAEIERIDRAAERAKS